MDAEQKYVVYSDGFPLSGFNKDDVATALCGLFSIPKDKIEERLLGGHSSKIRSYDDLSDAEALTLRLRKCGLSCEVTPPRRDMSPPTTDAESERKSDSGVATNSSPAAKSGFMRKLIAFIGLFLVVAPVLYFSITNYLVNKTTESVSYVESALFSSQSPDAILHADLAQIRRLLSLLDDNDLSEAAGKAIGSAPLLGPWGAASDNKEDRTSALLSATSAFTASLTLPKVLQNETPGDNAELGLTIVLHGDYSHLNVKQELSKYYQFESSAEDILTLTAKAGDDGLDTKCKIDAVDQEKDQLPPTFAQIYPGVIVLSSTQAALVTFGEAFGTDDIKHENDEAFSTWQNYRNSSLFAMSVFDEQLTRRDFSTAIATKALFEDNLAKKLSLRLMAKPLQQALFASFDAEMSDTVAAKHIAKKIEDGIVGLSKQNETDFPAVVGLLSRLEVNSDSALHIKAKLDKEVVGELESLVSELFEMVFVSHSDSDEIPQPVSEELDTHAWDYSLNDTLFTNFKTESDQFTSFAPMLERDGVGIYLESMTMESPLKPVDNEQKVLQLTYAAKRPAPFGEAFFGWSDSGIRQTIEIIDVSNKAGESLLADEHCVDAPMFQKRNHELSEVGRYSNGVIQTTKKVRLVDSATVKNIGVVRGRYDISAPINVVGSKLDLSNPLAEWPGGSFRLTQIEGGRVSYILRGDDSYLLEVRGLNSQGQALSFTSGFSSSGSKRRTKNFKGEVTAVEVMLAGQFKEKSFEFEIKDVFPKLLDTASNKSSFRVPVSFDKAKLPRYLKKIDLGGLSDQERQELSRSMGWGLSIDATKEHEIGSVTVGAATLFFMHDHSVKWNQKLRGAILFPHDPSLHSSNEAVEVALTLDGDEQKSTFVNISVSTRNGEVQPYLTLQGSGYDIGFFELPLSEHQGPIVEIFGKLIYRFPTAIETTAIEIQDTQEITLKGYDFGWSGKVTYELNGGFADSFYAIVRSNNSDLGGSKTTVKDEKTVLEFAELLGYDDLASLRLYSASDSIVKQEAFTLNPVYK